MGLTEKETAERLGKDGKKRTCGMRKDLGCENFRRLIPYCDFVVCAKSTKN